MARKKNETVSMDEVREEIAQAPAEVEAPGEEAEVTDPEGEGETSQEESAPDDVEAEAAEEEKPFVEGEAYKVIDDTRIVRVELTKDELIEQGRIMIEALDEAERARASLKAHSAECKANEEAAREKAGEAKALMRAKSEERHVQCHQIHNWTRNKVYTVRLDTHEIIGVREMNNYEKQTEIPEAEPEEAQTEIDTEAGQAEPGAEEATEAQADSDAVDDLDFDGDSEAEGELVGVGAGTGDEEIEIED